MLLLFMLACFMLAVPYATLYARRVSLQNFGWGSLNCLRWLKPVSAFQVKFLLEGSAPQRCIIAAKTSIQPIPAGCKLCSKVTHGPYSDCQRRHCLLSVRPC